MTTLFLRALRHRWLEHMLGATIIAVVAAVLIAQRSVTVQAEGAVHDLAHKLGKNMLVVPAGTNLSDFHAMRYGAAVIPDHYPRALRASPLAGHIKLIQPRLYGNLTVRGTDLVIVGEDAEGPGPRTSDNQVRVTRGAARALNLRPGDVIALGGDPVTVREVVEPHEEGLDMAVFTTLADAQRILNRPRSINAMRLGGCWCRIDVPTLGAEVEKKLPGTRAITITGMLNAQTGTVGVMKRYSILLLGVGFVFVVAVVASLTSSQVRRETRESGMILALGASPALVISAYILRASVVGLTGAAIAAAFGSMLTARLGAAVLEAPVSTAPGVAVPVLVACVLVSAAAAYVPARRAGRMDPVDVLREG